jgi:4-hydroxybenzoate polyprenyltransferase
VFALPFALLAVFLAAGYDGFRTPTVGEVVLIVVCMFFARTYAMLANRYLDRQVDAANPRTEGRAIPSQRVSAGTVRIAAGLAALGLILGAAGFGIAYGNWWPAAASPLVLAWLGAYPLAKRVTFAAHFMLGGALALSPLAAGLAVHPPVLAEPGLWLLAGFVLLWVGGFDIIYAVADIDVDRELGLHSIPAKLGQRGALIAAKLAHLVALGLLVGVYRLEPFLHTYTLVPDRSFSLFLVATVIVALVLMAEHRAADRRQFSMAFFTFNGLVAMTVGALGITDVLLVLG